MNVLMKSNFPMKSPNLTASSQNTSLTASFKKMNQGHRYHKKKTCSD